MSPRAALALVVAVLLPPPAAHALQWNLASSDCEPPDVFFSAAHDPAVTTPCCPRPPERCPGGVACVGGTCAAPYGTVPCAAPAPVDVPNVILYVADDQGWCHFGFMGPGCGTSKSGTVIPVPLTPNLDALALQPANQGRGRLFEIAYGNAAWSLPARETLATGQLRKENVDPNVPRRSIAELIKQPGGPVYCSFAGGGKIGGNSEPALGYAAWNDGRRLGETPCEAAPCAPDCDDPPRCGADIPGGVPENLQDVFDFVDSTLVGPRTNGALDPGTTYTQAQPFFLWFGSALPHIKHNPPAVIEDRFHLPDPTDYLFGPSAATPGQPRFPFAEPRYAAAFTKYEPHFRGLYGMVWWGDDGLRQLRRRLEAINVWDPTGTQSVPLWERTVIIFLVDNGADLPRSKRNFTQNGYRGPMILHDGRLPASANEPRIAEELVHHIDVMPTVVALSGRPVPPLPGLSLASYLSAAPPTQPLRNTMCGHETKSWIPRTNRFIHARPGTIGRCAPATGPACTTDGDCGGDVCLLGTCASGVLCMEDGDCRAGETCGGRQQKWCRFGHHPLLETSIPPPDRQPTVPCTTDADCAADCPSADPINCTCQYRVVKLYALSDGARRLMDLFVDPNEPGLDKSLRRKGPQPGDVPVGADDPHHPLAARLGCCLDRWWTPPPSDFGPLGDPACTACEPQYECHRCGDGVIASVEQCDGTNLGGRTCPTLGFTGGTLACAPDCTLDTTGCS